MKWSDWLRRLLQNRTPGPAGGPQTQPVRRKKVQPVLQPPAYRDRHRGATFLVLGNGPSLEEYRDAIFAFIEKYRPIVLGANNITGFLYPHYHAFTNRRRFHQYAHTIDPRRSRVLLSPYFPEAMIRKRYSGPFEPIMYVNDHNRAFDIQDGIIQASCRTVSVLLIGVALVMGAERIFVAGLDGYRDLLRQQRNVYYYTGETDYGPRPDEKISYLLDVERLNARFLHEIRRYMVDHGVEPFRILTPTTYQEHYQDIRAFL